MSLEAKIEELNGNIVKLIDVLAKGSNTVVVNTTADDQSGKIGDGKDTGGSSGRGRGRPAGRTNKGKADDKKVQKKPTKVARNGK